jgi:hypothetical protein
VQVLGQHVYPLGESLPEPVREIVWDPVFAYVGCWWYGGFCPVLDWMLCPVFRDHVTDVPGVLETEDDGDLHVLGQWIWDCEPYDQ